MNEITLQSDPFDTDALIIEISKHVDLIKWFEIELKVRQKMLDKQKELSSNFKTYVMLNKRNGFYKIGKALNPTIREKTLQSEEPDIELILIIPFNIERILHNKFKDKRIRGEWFKLSNSDLNYIKNRVSK